MPADPCAGPIFVDENLLESVFRAVESAAIFVLRETRNDGSGAASTTARRS
jgi:hypothetical protein